jgi:hypothetical protein
MGGMQLLEIIQITLALAIGLPCAALALTQTGRRRPTL